MASSGLESAAVQKRIDRVVNRFGDRLITALYRRAEMIMTVSKRDFVPVDMGTLRASGHVSPPERRGREISVTLAYGGAASAYALAVHEHPSRYSPPSWKAAKNVRFSPTGHGPKYLERPLMAAVGTLAADLASDLGVDSL